MTTTIRHEVQWHYPDTNEWHCVNSTSKGEVAGRKLYTEALVSGRSCALRLVKIVERKEVAVEVLEPHG